MADRRAELERELEENRALLVEHGLESEDPNPELLVQAWGYIGWVLGELERFEEAIEAADNLLALAADLGDAIDDCSVAMALRCKREALAILDRRADADAVDVESFLRFRDSDDPEAREQAAVSLSYHSHWLLRSPDRFAEGLALTSELIDLLEAEPDESLLGMADVAAGHMHLLLNAHSDDLLGVAWMAMEMLWSHTRTVSGRVWSSVRRVTPVRLPTLSYAAALSDALTPSRFQRTYCRAATTLVLGTAIVQRLKALENDAETAPLCARVELFSNFANLILGQADAFDMMNATHERRDPDIAAAYQHLADAQSSSGRFVQDVGTIATLRLRAEALIGDDPASARIAFQDSLERAIPGPVSRPIRWLIAYLSSWP